MKEIFKRNFYVISVALIAIVITFILVANALSKGMEERNNQAYLASLATQNYTPVYAESTDVAVEEEIVTIKKNKKFNTENKETAATTDPATENTTEATTKLTMATAATQKTTASYQNQWDKGYLLALDYPDQNYSSGHVELSDENRALVESICMAENEAGGFIGAALVAQSIKNAMEYYGTENVDGLRSRLHYSRGKNPSVSKDVRDAVIYVFDMDKDAVQHRIFYKYKPATKDSLSEFHENKTYVCTYKDVRFFDE